MRIIYRKLRCGTPPILALLLTIAVTGCQSQPPENNAARDFESAMAENFKRIHDPSAAVGKIRQYAIETLQDISDEEYQCIIGSAPAISTNFDQTEYAFFWTCGKNRKGIEVLATPPPCTPIAVFRVNRIYFP